MIRSYLPSPTGQTIAVTTSNAGDWYQRTLRLLTDSGKEIEALDNARRYAWNPKGGSIAFITSNFRGIYTKPESTGTWIFKIKDKVHTKIFERGDRVAWSAFDNNVYIYDVGERADQDRVWRYNTSTGEIAPTGHKGIYFSASGDYYYMTAVRRFEIYETATENPVGVRSHSILGKLFPQPIGWETSGSDELFLFTTAFDAKTGKQMGGPKTMAYNPRTNTLRDFGFKGNVGSDHGHLILFNGSGQFEKKALKDLLNPHQEKGGR